jgi:hypothetical protein
MTAPYICFCRIEKYLMWDHHYHAADYWQRRAAALAKRWEN